MCCCGAGAASSSTCSSCRSAAQRPSPHASCWLRARPPRLRRRGPRPVGGGARARAARPAAQRRQQGRRPPPLISTSARRAGPPSCWTCRARRGCGQRRTMRWVGLPAAQGRLRGRGGEPASGNARCLASLGGSSCAPLRRAELGSASASPAARCTPPHHRARLLTPHPPPPTPPPTPPHPHPHPFSSGPLCGTFQGLLYQAVCGAAPVGAQEAARGAGATVRHPGGHPAGRDGGRRRWRRARAAGRRQQLPGHAGCAAARPGASHGRALARRRASDAAAGGRL